MSNSEIGSPNIPDGGDDDDVCGGDCDADRKNQRGIVVRYRRDFRKAKRMIISRFGKKPPQPQQRQRSLLHPLLKKEDYAYLGSGSAVTSRRGNRMLGCCLCLKQPLTMESRFGSDLQPPDDDPQNPELFTSECLKSLIENNDFYSKHCNPHIDFVSYSKD